MSQPTMVVSVGRWGMGSVRGWFLARDQDLLATRRAARTAIVMPAMFALGWQVIGNPTVATFAAFGSFAMLLLADFGGSVAERLAAQAGLVVAGCVLVCLGTFASSTPWLAAVAMLAVGFVVLFVGVVSSVLAGASSAALLSFILPVATPAGPGSIPARLAGWLLAGLVSLPAVSLLWPAPRRERLRDATAEACRALSERLSAEVARWQGEDATEVEAAVARSDAAVAALRTRFLGTPYRPSGLSAGARSLVRVVDEVLFLDVVLRDAAAVGHRPSVDATVRAVKTAAAALLEHAGKSLDRREPPQDSLHDHLADLARARALMAVAAADAVAVPPADGAVELADFLGPSFRAQQLSFVTAAIANNVEAIVAADVRPWRDKLLGRGPNGLVGPLTSAWQRALAHLEPHSVWLHNSIRGAIALAAAVLVAHVSEVQHSFWIVLGALSVLRSNALNTGQNVLRGLVGTALGFVIGGALVVALGTSRTLLWALLPVAILAAGIAPAVSFTAGQAGFTVALLILFNIISPAGWQVGLVRVEDVAIGFAVSLLVGALFWPRGAAAAMRRTLSEAYADAAAYLREATETGTGDPAARNASEAAASRSAAAARRLDDAFREFLAERGPKPLTVAQVAVLLTGVSALRLTAQAVAYLWRDDGDGGIQTPRAQLELIVTTERVTNWYAATAQAFVAGGTVPRPLPRDHAADDRLFAGLRADLDAPSAANPRAKAHIVRLVWTSDHVGAARRLQQPIELPARLAADARPAWPPVALLQGEPVAAAPLARSQANDPRRRSRH